MGNTSVDLVIRSFARNSGTRQQNKAPIRLSMYHTLGSSSVQGFHRPGLSKPERSHPTAVRLFLQYFVHVLAGFDSAGQYFGAGWECKHCAHIGVPSRQTLGPHQ